MLPSVSFLNSKRRRPRVVNVQINKYVRPQLLTMGQFITTVLAVKSTSSQLLCYLPWAKYFNSQILQKSHWGLLTATLFQPLISFKIGIGLQAMVITKVTLSSRSIIKANLNITMLERYRKSVRGYTIPIKVITGLYKTIYHL